MPKQRRVPDEIDVSAASIGGIDRTEVTLRGGVNVLVGRNATNRTSFLQAIMAAMGSEDVSLKGDAEEGRVSLEIDGTTYTRTLRRRGGGIVFDGDAYLDDPTEADLFAFLLETNEARRAVAADEDLRDVIMRPVDTDAIERRIDELLRERDEIDAELEAIESKRDRLTELEARRQSLSEDAAEKREELEAVEDSIEDADAELETKRAERDEFEETLAELKDVRSALEDVRYRLETERESLESAREELEEVREERESFPDSPDDELAELDRRIENLRSRKRDCESAISTLGTVVQFNEEMLDGDGGLRQLLDEEEGEVTDELLPESGTVTCWTCGSSVEPDKLEETLDGLRELSREKRAERSEVDDEIEDLSERRREIESQRDARERLENRERELEAELDRRESDVEDLLDERDELREQVEELEARTDDLEGDDETEVIELHKRANRLEVELDRVESDRREVDDRIESLEADVDEAESLQERRGEITEELSQLRTRIDRLEAGAVEEFNEHMERLLDRLSYANIERIWIERVERDDGPGRGGSTRPTFDLHVVRTNDAGTTYEDTVAHLSESEREVTGLVFALAGYLVHETYETVPLMLLDSLEAIDSDRIAALVEYLREYAPALVVALLPEDAAALDGSPHRIEEI